MHSTLKANGTNIVAHASWETKGTMTQASSSEFKQSLISGRKDGSHKTDLPMKHGRPWATEKLFVWREGVLNKASKLPLKS